jgi:hypothetical protein
VIQTVLEAVPALRPAGEREKLMAADGSGVAELTRIKYGAGLILAAFVFLIVVLMIALSQFEAVADVTSLVGVFTGVVGTLVGAFFGVQAGAAGKDKAEKDRDKNAELARRAIGMLPPDQARTLI